MGRIVRSDDAERDLDEIGLHIARGSGSLDVALRFLDKINGPCAAYARQPEMGDPRPDLGENLRLFPVGDYVVVYRPLDDRQPSGDDQARTRPALPQTGHGGVPDGSDSPHWEQVHSAG